VDRVSALPTIHRVASAGDASSANLMNGPLTTPRWAGAYASPGARARRDRRRRLQIQSAGFKWNSKR